MDDPDMETEAASRRPLDVDVGAAVLSPPMMTGRHSTRLAGSAVVPSGPQSSPASHFQRRDLHATNRGTIDSSRGEGVVS